MKLRCECGRQFEAPDGVRQAACPDCGRQVSAGEGDWLGALDVEDLELDVKEKPALAPAATAEPPPADTPKEAPQTAPRAPVEIPVRVERSAPGGPEVAPPRRLLDLLRQVRDEPFALMSSLRSGVRSERFLAELGVCTAALALVWSITGAALAGGPGVGEVVVKLVRFLVELGAAAVMLALLTVLLKRDSADRPHPLGVVEGVVLTRLLGLALVVPLGIALAVAVSLTGGVQHAPGVLRFLAQHVTRLYTLIVFAAQTSFVMGLLKVGCLPGVILSAVVSYSAAALAGG
jgi:hypothetical protein